MLQLLLHLLLNMPRCNLTLKQKCQIIELSKELSTDQLAKRFRVHPTTVNRILKKKEKIFDYSSKINVNYKTIQTNRKGGEHDEMILDYIKQKQNANEAITIKEICDKAVEFAKLLNRSMKSRRAWWRRFKVRCNIIKSKLPKNPSGNPPDSPNRRDVKQKVDKKAVSSAKKKYTFKVKGNQLAQGPSDETINQLSVDDSSSAREQRDVQSSETQTNC